MSGFIYLKAAKQLATSNPTLLHNMVEESRCDDCPRSCIDGYVYAMECDQRLPGMVFYKIGQSYQPQIRVKQVNYQMRWGSWRVVHQMFTFGGLDIVERSLHCLFKDKRALQAFSREIFKLSENDVGWLKSFRGINAVVLQNKLVDWYWDAYNRRYGINI